MGNNPSFALRSSRKKVKDTINLRQITLDEAKTLRNRDNVWVIDRNGNAASVRVNSSVKRWKKDPDRIEIGFAYGLYEKFRLDTLSILRDIYVEE